jgi:hypothetical protein
MSSPEIRPSIDRETPKSKPQLSVTQILASVLAAVTATFAASYFGVSGTIIGAALASVVTVVGNAVYSHSIQRTGERVRNAVPIPVWPPLNARAATARHVPPAPPETAALPGSRGPVLGWRHAAVAAAGLFLVIAGIVTGIELAAGRPLANLVHDRSGSGTSLFGGSHPTSSTTPATPTPAATPTRTSPAAPGRTSAPPAAPQNPTQQTPTPAPSSTATTTQPPTGQPTPSDSVPATTPTNPTGSPSP